MPRPFRPPSPWAPLSDQSWQRRQHVWLEGLPGLYERVPLLASINFLVAVILVVLFWSTAPQRHLLAWFASMLLALGLRLLCWAAWRHMPGAHQSLRWLGLLVGTTALVGAMWGLAGILFHGAGSVVYDLALGFTIGGMVAGSAMSLTAFLPAFFAFYVPALAPYAVRLAFGPGPTDAGMSLLVTAFGIGIGVLGLSIHRSLHATEERYRRVVEDQSDLICRFRPDGTLIFVNGAYARSFGKTQQDLIGVNFLSFLPEEAREETRRKFSSLSPEQPTVTYEHPVLRPGGGILWQQWRDRGIFDARGHLIELQSVGRDITERKEVEEALRRARDQLGDRVEQRTAELRAANEALSVEVAERRRIEAALRRSEHRLRVALKAARMGVWEQDLRARRLYWSPEMERLFGLAPGSFSGRFSDFLDLVHPEDRQRLAQILSDRSRPFAARDVEYRLIRPDGSLRWIASFGEPVHNGSRPTKLAGVAMDITERKQVEEHAIRLAHHDALTGLPNRRLLEDRLEQAIVRARRDGELVAVLLLDLDNFKHVNDSRGHPVGDKLLCGVAERLCNLVRESDTLARLGGDEFAVVQVGLAAEGGAEVLARKLIDGFAEPFCIEQEEIHTTTSVGFSLFPAHGESAAHMIKNADVALYRAKAEGRNRICRFSGWMTAQVSARQSLETRLREGLKKQDLVLHYQPVLDVASGRITGVEALVRWRQERDDLLLPEGFLALAETTGLIRPLGAWVLAEACRQAVDWQARGYPLTMAVNLSVAQVRNPDDAAMLSGIVRASGVDPGQVELEITENTFLDPALGSMTSTLGALATTGIRLSIDDFGTGYSSLAYLKHIPAHTIKIDRSFVQDIDRQDDQAIAIAILALGRNLGRQVIAEGVETGRQMAILSRLGCRYMQGFFIGRPRPPADLEAFLDDWPSIWTEMRRCIGPAPPPGGDGDPPPPAPVVSRADAERLPS
ncbi:MAG TPA: EAL domain-containing protein [Geminicoccaceae bacterium]